MKTFEQYLFESSSSTEAAKIEKALADKKYIIRNRIQKQSPNIIIVNTDEDDRVKVLRKIADLFDGTYDPSLNKSSVGGVKIGNVKVFVKHNTFAGQSAGEHAEPGVAYIFNKLHNVKFESETVNEANIDNEIYQTLIEHGLTEEWIQSSYSSAVKIISEGYDNKTYLAVHVNGDDFIDIPDDIRKVADIFYGKSKLMSSLQLKSKKDLKYFNDLYVGIKDNWNKADIVLVDKTNNVYQQIMAANIVDSTSLNSALNILIEDNRIIPISLKKVEANAKVSQIKFEKEGNSSSIDQNAAEISQIQKIHLKWPERKLDPNSQDCSCYLVTDNGLKIQFRRMSGSGNNLSVELMLKGARGGKPITQVKNDLKIISVDNKYCANFTSENDFYRKLKNVLQLSPEEIGKMPDKAKNGIKDWYNRVCFQGLVGLLAKYHQVYNGKTLKDFFQYLHSFASGSKSKSIFYLLTMK